jgi:hypothetical protein
MTRPRPSSKRQFTTSADTPVQDPGRKPFIGNGFHRGRITPGDTIEHQGRTYTVSSDLTPWLEEYARLQAQPGTVLLPTASYGCA